MAFGYKRIFAALDGASTQRAVMERAIALAEEEHAELTFGHVIDSVPYEASGVDFELLCNEGKIRIETDLADLLEKARNNADSGFESYLETEKRGPMAPAFAFVLVFQPFRAVSPA